MTEGKFQVEVCARISWPVERLRPPRVSAVLGEALSNTTSGRRETSKPEADQPNSYRGILQWRARTRKIIAYSLFHRDGAVEKIYSKRNVLYIQLPYKLYKIMTDQEIKILTSTDTPGKVVQDAIFFLSTQWQGKDSRVITGDMIPTSRGGSVAGALEDVVKIDQKRKDESGAGNNCPLKQCNLSEFPHNSGRGGRKGGAL